MAGKDERDPRKPPIGVRATPTMQTSDSSTFMYQKVFIFQIQLTNERVLLPLGFTDSDVWAITNLQNGVKSQQGTNLIKSQIHLGSE